MTYQDVCASAFVVKFLELSYGVYYWKPIKFHVFQHMLKIKAHLPLKEHTSNNNPC